MHEQASREPCTLHVEYGFRSGQAETPTGGGGALLYARRRCWSVCSSVADSALSDPAHRGGGPKRARAVQSARRNHGPSLPPPTPTHPPCDQRTTIATHSFAPITRTRNPYFTCTTTDAKRAQIVPSRVQCARRRRLRSAAVLSAVFPSARRTLRSAPGETDLAANDEQGRTAASQKRSRRQEIPYRGIFFYFFYSILFFILFILFYSILFYFYFSFLFFWGGKPSDAATRLGKTGKEHGAGE